MEDYRWAEVRKWFNWLGLQVGLILLAAQHLQTEVEIMWNT